MEIIRYKNKGKEFECHTLNGVLVARTCSTCMILKSSDNFFKSEKRFLGHYPTCKICCAIKGNNNYKNNKNLIQKRNSIYYKNNKDKIKRKVAEYTKANRQKYNEYTYARDRDKRQRVLSVLFLRELRQLYKECKEISTKTQIKYVVDHIVPLYNEQICGLHVPWNVQFLTVHENAVKSNKWDGTFDNNSWRKDVE